MSIQHTRFLRRLRSSSLAVFAVAEHHHCKGRTVEIPALRFAPTADQAEHYHDNGDLIVIDGESRYRFEVKHLSAEFTSADDWPYREVFVSNVSGVDRAGDAVSAYVSVNASLTHCVIIPLKTTKPHWYIVEHISANTGNTERTYACPLHLVIFKQLASYKQSEAA